MRHQKPYTLLARLHIAWALPLAIIVLLLQLLSHVVAFLANGKDGYHAARRGW